LIGAKTALAKSANVCVSAATGGNYPCGGTSESISAQISAIVVLHGVDASSEANIWRMRRNCSSRGNSSHAAISSSVGVADGMTVLSVSTIVINIARSYRRGRVLDNLLDNLRCACSKVLAVSGLHDLTVVGVLPIAGVALSFINGGLW
jgi:hypothetical protein